MSLARVRGLRLPGRASSTATTPWRTGASSATRLARLAELARASARAPGRRRRAPTSRWASPGRTWIPCDGDGELPRRRGLHRARGDQRRGRDPLHLPGGVRGPLGRGRRARASAGGEVVEATRRRRARSSCARCSRWTTARAGVGEFAFGMNEAITEFTRQHALRREDRRHGPPRARRGRIRRRGGTERVGAPLGPRLRPAHGQRGLRGRRARLPRRRFLARPRSDRALRRHAPAARRAPPARRVRARCSSEADAHPPCRGLHGGRGARRAARRSRRSRPCTATWTSRALRERAARAPRRRGRRACGSGSSHDAGPAPGRHERLVDRSPAATSSPTGIRTSRRSLGTATSGS